MFNCFSNSVEVFLQHHFIIYNSGILFSDDTGMSWQQRNNDGYLTGGFAMVSFNATIILGSTQGIWRSVDTGQSWKALPCDYDTTQNTAHFGSDTAVSSLAFDGGYLYAGGYLGGVFRSSDAGMTWQNVLPLDLPAGRGNPVQSLTAYGGNIFAGTYQSGIFRSSDHGNTWDSSNNGISASARIAQALLATHDGVFAGLLVGGGVYYSSDSGRIWVNFTVGMTGGNIECLDTGLGYLFAGGQYGLYRRPLSDFNNLDVVSSGTSIPTPQIQSYPNPLSQSTSITFMLPEASEVTLSITNALGCETPLLHSAWMDAGEHEITWDASKIPSGVYLCRLSSGGESVTELVVVLH